MSYTLYSYSCFDDFNKADFYKLEFYHWEAETPYRPDTYFKIGVVNDELVAVLKCYEESPKAEYINRDDPVYLDSCLEFFVAPVENREEYINVEMNSKGAFLCEFGKLKPERCFASEITSLSPEVETFTSVDDNGSFWGVKVRLAKDFISALYKTDKKNIMFKEIRANFYKCGDECATPHYLAFSPVTTLPPGFHNPECFAEFKGVNY
ncbi:MAG: hypothetical protein J6B35_03625 [Clostridia bacterium]|nr:hypothetical protein [Clostridia bacterium]